jgi:hypothetical protein
MVNAKNLVIDHTLDQVERAETHQQQADQEPRGPR